MMNVSRNWPSGNHRLDLDAAGRRLAAAGPDRRCTLRSGGPSKVSPAPPGRPAWRQPAIGIDAAREDAGQRRGERRLRHVLRAQLQLRRAALSERVHQRAADDFVHERLIAEPDLRLRRMHVHVERVRRHLDEQVHLGAALLDRRLAVGVDDRVRDRLVLDDAPVDEDVLRTARRPLLGQRGDEAGEPDAAGLLAHFHQVAPLAVELIQPVATRHGGRALQHGPPGARQREADLRIRQRQLRDDARDLRRLGAVRLQELPPRRQVVEQVVDLDDRALRRADLDDRRHRAAVDADLGAALLAARARPEDEVRHRRDGRQRLAAEPERQDRREIVRPPDLARRVALDRQPRILRPHPFPIVLDADLFLAAELDVDREAARAGIDRVLDELLDDGRGTLDHFAGRDLVRELRRQEVDRAHVRSSGGRRQDPMRLREGLPDDGRAPSPRR